MLKEACAENFTHVPELIERGADRIELNDNMAQWGTTPSVGVITETLSYCHAKGIPVITMVRPRGGNFVYSETEKKIMLQDLRVAIELGVDGIAIGALTKESELDIPFLTEVVRLAKVAEIEVTFHRAFDAIPFEKQVSSLRWLAEKGITRVAMHGGDVEQTIEETLPRLKELSALEEDIILMIAGGIRRDNIELIRQELPTIKEAHGTKIV